jgi:Arc/MetJ-type ribon-helix-helix transcriptional regulator
MSKRERMIVISFHVSKSLLDAIDDLVRRGVFPSRSEALREAIRLLVEQYVFARHETQPQ